jgi:VWFA-related protein
MGRRWRARVVSICLAAAAGFSAAVFAQQPAFRAGVELVTLDVGVLDQQRRPVTGLTAGDFRVTVEGRDVPVVSFAAVDRASLVGEGPGGRPAAGPIVALTPTSEIPRDSDRVLVVMFDRSIPTGEPTNRARAIARAVVESASPDDHIAVVRSSGFSNEGGSVEPTRDRTSLLEAINSPFTGMVAVPEMILGYGLESRPPDLFSTGDCLCGLCVFETLEHVARALENEPRQKALFFVGSDIIIQPRPTDPQGCQQHLKEGRIRVLRALDRANVTVHAFDVYGLETLARGADTFPTGHRGRPPVSRHLERQGNLAVLPDFTGGRVVLNTNTPELMVPAVLAESSSYYVLGIERDPSAGAEEQRAVRVRVNRRGATVRSRTAYYGGSPASASPR